MWQRFSDRARKAVFYAQEVAQQYGSAYVEPKHLIHGCLRDDSTAIEVLRAIGIERQSVIEQLALTSEGDHHGSDMTLTPKSKRAIDLAYQFARELKHSYVGTEHMFLGSLAALKVDESVAVVYGVNLEAFLEKTREVTLGRTGPIQPSRSEPPPGGESAANLISAIINDSQAEAHDYLRELGLTAHLLHELAVHYLKASPISIDARLTRASDVASTLDQPMTSKHIAFAILDLVLDDERREVAFEALGGTPPEEG